MNAVEGCDYAEVAVGEDDVFVTILAPDARTPTPKVTAQAQAVRLVFGGKDATTIQVPLPVPVRRSAPQLRVCNGVFDVRLRRA